MRKYCLNIDVAKPSSPLLLAIILTISIFIYSTQDVDSNILVGLSIKNQILLDRCGVEVNDWKDNNENSTLSSSTKPQYCSDIHREAIQFCSTNNNNRVINRIGTATQQQILQRWGEQRTYSLSSHLLENNTTPLPRCQSLEDYLKAIKYGKRIWPTINSTSNNSNDKHDLESMSSIFIPHECYTPVLPPPPERTCEILNSYSHVIFHGDSLTRHLRQAIYMSMREDYMTGGLMTEDTNIRESCKCDGQFSEARLCRASGGYFDETIQPHTIPKENLCPNATFSMGKRANAPFLVRKGKKDPGEHIDWNDVRCADEDYKGILIALQGGLHWFMNATDTFDSLIQPVITHDRFHECLSLGKVRLVWIAMTAQSRLLDDPYSHQKRENAVLFNEEIRKSFIKAGYPDILILDWYNMTNDSQTSDGLHSLTEVNLAKASQLLYLVEHWAQPTNHT